MLGVHVSTFWILMFDCQSHLRMRVLREGVAYHTLLLRHAKYTEAPETEK